MDKAEAISRAAAAAAAENCCAREKAKKERKISIGFSIFFSLFVFVLFGVDEREGRGVNRLEGELCWNFTVVFALWLPQGMAGERGVEGGGGTVRAYCVDVWREFSINEKRTARHDAAKAMGAAVLVQHATQRKLHTGLCVCQMVPRGMCNGGR